MNYYLIQTLVTIGILVVIFIISNLLGRLGRLLAPEDDPVEQFMIGVLVVLLGGVLLIGALGALYGLWCLAGSILDLFIQPEILV